MMKPGRKKNTAVDFRIESFGVKISITADAPEMSEKIEAILHNALPGCFRMIDETKVEHRFEIFAGADGENFLYKDDKEVPNDHSRFDMLRGFETQLRLTVAEFAVERVFVHAGVVAWKGSAIVIPANSFRGKTSLVAALVKLGAEYYSDEYAIFDADGFVHPFPKTLSVRGEIDEYTQKEYPVEAFGGKAGIERLPVGMILITEYKPRARWKPVLLSPGQGMLEILSHVVPIRYNPRFSVEVLNRVVNRAIIAKTFRGDVTGSAQSVLDFFESMQFKN